MSVVELGCQRLRVRKIAYKKARIVHLGELRIRDELAKLSNSHADEKAQLEWLDRLLRGKIEEALGKTRKSSERTLLPIVKLIVDLETRRGEFFPALPVVGLANGFQEKIENFRSLVTFVREKKTR